MQSYIKIGVFVCIITTLAFLGGRLSSPAKIKIEEKIRVVEVEKIVERRQANVVTERKIETRPDGSSTTTEHIRDASVTDRASSRETEIEKEKKTLTKSLAGRTTVFGGMNAFNSRTYMAGIQHDIIGPFGVAVIGTFGERSGFSGYLGLSLRF